MRLLCIALGLCLLGLDAPIDGGEPKKAPLPTFQVPYRMSAANHVVVRAKINGKGPYNFILDTGAPAVFIDKDLAKTLELKVEKSQATLDRLEVEGGAALTKFSCIIETPFQLSAMNALGLAGVELHGIIGYTYLAHFKMELDFTRDKMTWTRLDFDPPPPARIGAPGGSTGMPGLKILNPGVKKAGAVPEVRGFVGIELAEAQGKVRVQSVLAKSPAEKAGLKAGDEIRQVQGNAVKTGLEVHRQLVAVTAGQTVRFTIVRDDKEQEINVTAGEGF